jgi:bifunctional isochorismate lyase/aryl carrier protein
MKEEYFKPSTSEAVAREFINSTAAGYLKRKQEMVLNRTDSALLVLDMQRYFLEVDSHAYIPSAKAIIPNIKRLQDYYLDLGLPVIHTRHINNWEDALQMKNWWRDLITADNPYSEVIHDIRDGKVILLNKTQYDAFFNTSLAQVLKEKGSGQVVITGVMTHLCCETTARSAFVRGFEVLFAVDATATYNRRFHQASLLNLSHGFAFPVLTREILSAPETGGTGRENAS